MTHSYRLILAAFALGASLVVARAESPHASTATTRTVSPVLAALDLDRDGTLSARELAAAPVLLSALDLNADGKISPDERQALSAEGRPVRAARGATTFTLVLALDANADGDLQLMELANAVSSLQRLDVNHDGQLTPNELRPALVAHHRPAKPADRSSGS